MNAANLPHGQIKLGQLYAEREWMTHQFYSRRRFLDSIIYPSILNCRWMPQLN